MDIILEYRAYLNILLLVIGAITALLLFRPFLNWYVRQNDVLKELREVNSNLKKQTEATLKLQQMFANQQAMMFNRQSQAMAQKTTPEAAAYTPPIKKIPQDQEGKGRQEPTINFD